MSRHYGGLTMFSRNGFCVKCARTVFGIGALTCVFCGGPVDDPHPHEEIATAAIYAPPVRAITSTNTTITPGTGQLGLIGYRPTL